MSSNDETANTVKATPWWVEPLRITGIATAVAFAIWGAFYLVFRGTASIIAAWVSSSTSLKVIIITSVVMAAAALFIETRATAKAPKPEPRGYYSSYNRRRDMTKASFVVVVAGVVVMLLAVSVIPVWGGYTRGQTLAEATSFEEGGLANYEWRTPWDVASEGVAQRADVEQGDFAAESTTYLPAENAYSTPVAGRGFAAGYTQVVIQKEGSTRTTSCEFSSEVPRPGGMFASNLRRAVALVDSRFVVNYDDVWGFCEGDEARLVVPVTVMRTSLGEGYPVPAGVVVFDGENASHLREVSAGEFPGPVYPMSLAAAQRTALHSTSSIFDKVFSRAGYELSDGSYDTGREDQSAKLNNSEFLLARADGEGYDFVTPLTPRSNSERITAVSTIAADHVRYGELNEFTVHTLGENSQRGNVDQVSAIRANFPNLGWETGVAVAEIVPTGDGVWEASLRNGAVVARRVLITSDRMCLLTPAGEQTECTADTADSNGGTAEVPPATETDEGTDPMVPAPELGDLAGLSDEELLALIDATVEELRSRSSS